MADLYPTKLIPPSDRYPKSVGSETSNLVYLAWGERNYENESIPIHRNPGWLYFVVEKGSVLVEFSDKVHFFEEGAGMLCGPDCPFGFPIQKDNQARVLAWIWKEKPDYMDGLLESQHRLFSFDSRQIELLKDLHKQCRMEQISQDSLSVDLLNSIRAMLNVVFCRAFIKRRDRSSEDDQFRMAQRWVVEHLGIKKPMKALASYLNISTTSLHRLFKKKSDQSPGTYFIKIKMEYCRDVLIRERISVKQLAYTMGYNNPNDFSRAFKNYFGEAPSRYVKEYKG